MASATASVGGVPLMTTTAGGWPLYYDQGVSPAQVAQASSALEAALLDVPRLSGLPGFRTPLAVYVMADQERFRLALAEVGQVRVELIANEVGGYTIERGGTMFVFLPADAVAQPDAATLLFDHELAHLAVREASQRKPVPQWFNEGYADWVAGRALGERFPRSAEDFATFNRAIVASAELSRGELIPWAELVTRTRFSQAGIQGFGGLAYAQGTEFVDWLAQRHGADAVARFLQAIATAPTVTEAFQTTLGPFAPQDEAFQADMRALTDEFGPGIHRISRRADVGQRVSFAVVGGNPNEAADLEFDAGDGPLLKRQRTLDDVGFLPIGLDETVTAQPGRRVVRVRTASLGLLEAEVLVGVPPELQPAPSPRAPVQLPRHWQLKTGCWLAAAA